ncbi:Putative retroelement [Phytophthora palmivora]|uniref:Retroelement n=1 Tax=Phytophthora palmivora TaxID=4796 RepID=A0A2P4XY34_9STRA|nr:Putative retroelement [Phytophthora palmivora]
MQRNRWKLAVLGRMYSTRFSKCKNYRAAQRVVRYALTTKDYGLVYHACQGPLNLEAFADADHARCPESSRSVTGFVIKLNGCIFDWWSKKQEGVTTNTCSSELMAWTQNLLNELRINGTVETTVFCDNQSALKTIEYNGNSERLRNYAKVIRYIAEHVEKGRLQMQYVPTTDNLADLFTKALGPQRFKQLPDGLCVADTKACWQATC